MTGMILVIKHGALGDIIQACPAFAAIRRHHAGQRIVGLSTPAFAGLLRASPYFDEVWEDPRAPVWRVLSWTRLIARLRRAGFARVYDLQNSTRTGHYRRLIGPGPEWSGTHRGDQLYYPRLDDPPRHNMDHFAEQLARAGIAMAGGPELSWLTGDTAVFALPQHFVLLVPGCSPHLPHKRWPHFPELAKRLVESRLVPVIVGTRADADAIAPICAAVPQAIDLAGRTDFGQVAALARAAAGAVANDTGPAFIIGGAGCPLTLLYSKNSDPARSVPRGAPVVVHKSNDIAHIPTDHVLKALQLRS